MTTSFEWTPDLILSHLSTSEEIDMLDSVGKTALCYAAMRGNYDLAKLLLEAGANINATCILHPTPLFAAMYSDHSNILNLFFEYGAVDQRLSLEDRTLLMQASSMGLTCYVEFLLAKGADVNATDFRGANPLIFAIANSKIDVAEVLIRYGADINPIFALDRTKYINYVPFLKGYIEANQDKLTPENLRKYKAYRLQAILS